MKKLTKLGVITLTGMSLAASSLFAGTVLSDKDIGEMVKNNTVLNNQNIKVKKAEKVSDNLTTIKLGVMYQTNQGVSERPAQAFVAKVDGKEYTFLGGGYDEKGAKIALSLDTATVDKGVLWSHGTGPEVIYLVTNPSCPWCEKFEVAVQENPDFLKKYTVKTFLMPFHPFANEKAAWVLAGATDAEKADRYKKIMVDKDMAWKDFKPTAVEQVQINTLLADSLAGAKELEAEGTPALFDSKFQPINNWPALIKAN